jgi:hypothetical protein
MSMLAKSSPCTKRKSSTPIRSPGASHTHPCTSLTSLTPTNSITRAGRWVEQDARGYLDAVRRCAAQVAEQLSAGNIDVSAVRGIAREREREKVEVVRRRWATHAR